MDRAAKKKNALALGVIASMVVFVSTLVLGSAASASNETPILTTTAPTATHVALKSRAEVFLGVSPKSVAVLGAKPVNATRYYEGVGGVALECTVAPDNGWAEVVPIFRARSGLRMNELIVFELNRRFVSDA